MTYFNYTFETPQQVNAKFNELVKYAGKKRIQQLMSIWANDNEIKPVSMMVKYRKFQSDCWEMTTFYDRITNKGFHRYDTEAIEKFCSLLIDVCNSAKKLNLIK